MLLYNPMLHEWFGFAAPVFRDSQWIAPVFARAVFFFGGLLLLRLPAPELRDRQSGTMT